jgi:hypothetical protein
LATSISDELADFAMDEIVRIEVAKKDVADDITIERHMRYSSEFFENYEVHTLLIDYLPDKTP